MVKPWNWMPAQEATPATGGFRLMRLFAVAGAVAIALFSLAMALVLSRFIEQRMLERDAALSRDFVQSIFTTQQVGGVFRGHDDVGSNEFNEFVTHLAAMPDVLRANVYTPQRRVLWSSRRELIGQLFEHNDELDEALEGRVVVHVVDKPETETKPEHLLLGNDSQRYVENYVPVRDEKTGEVRGVIELYRGPFALFDAIASGKRLVWVASTAGGAFLFGCLVWFVRRAERALNDQQSRLIEADALAMVGEISAAVAHSIRNPLGSIRTTAELQRELHGDADHAYGDIMRNVDRVELLVRTLLTYARDPAERLGSADIRAVLSEAVARFGPDLEAQGKHLALEMTANGTVPADPVLLAQIFNSVLANAAEATKAGGSVTVRGWQEGDAVYVDVSDDGAGIEAKRLNDIFKPFYTTKPKGLGMGLSLVRRIVDRLGGRVAVRSAPGEGTTLSIRLPLERKP
jgi:signal transduction histidine kinase